MPGTKTHGSLTGLTDGDARKDALLAEVGLEYRADPQTVIDRARKAYVEGRISLEKYDELVGDAVASES